MEENIESQIKDLESKNQDYKSLLCKFCVLYKQYCNTEISLYEFEDFISELDKEIIKECGLNEECL